MYEAILLMDCITTPIIHSSATGDTDSSVVRVFDQCSKGSRFNALAWSGTNERTPLGLYYSHGCLIQPSYPYTYVHKLMSISHGLV